MLYKLEFNHRQVLELAVPMIISNISIPLLGMVDTAVMGHQEHASYLGGVAIGSVIFNFIYWGFGFLRMSTTGLTAQAFGNHNDLEVKAILLRAVFLAGCIALVLLSLQKPLAYLCFQLFESSAATQHHAQQYFSIRIWSAPATFCLYALIGWFLGLQNVKTPLLIVLTSNICNILLDLIFVVALHGGISGVAYASVIAEYSGLFCALLLLRRQLKPLPAGWQWRQNFKSEHFKILFSINRDIFIRTLCLMFAFAFFTARGAKLGDVILAANAILLNFQSFMAYALDGFAHAAEALCGRALGAKNKPLLKLTIKTAAAWSILIAGFFSLAYALFGRQLIDLLSSIENVRSTAYTFLPWMIIMPLAAFISYLLDGIFIGLTWSRQMRNSMLFALICCYLPAWYFTQPLQNHGLWLALCIFMLARSLSMSWIINRIKII